MGLYELNINELVEEFATKKLNGLDYTEIRKELYERNIVPEMINQVIRIIDVRVLNSELLKKNLLQRKKNGDWQKILS